MSENAKKIIEKIRASIKKHNNSDYYGDMDDTRELIDNLIALDEVDWTIVKNEIEDRGDRWTHWQIYIYKITLGNESVYFKIEIEEGKTELQNIDTNVIVTEVKPKKIIIIDYVDIDE